MQNSSFLIAFALILLSRSATAVPTVARVNLDRYLGKWYEVASIPAFFQKSCAKNTTADYQSSRPGRIDVINRCQQSDGRIKTAKGTAFVVNTETQAELKVSFVPLLRHLGWFSGQYKVLALGEGYEYAVVGEDSHRFAWILARTPSLPRATLSALDKKIRDAGYDSCLVLMSLQDGGAVETRVPLCDFASSTK